MKPKPRLFPLRWWLQVGTLVVLLGGMMVWKPKACPLQTTSETIGDGLTLRKFAYNTPAGPTQIYVVNSDHYAAGGWRFNVRPAKGNIFQRETVTQIAQRENAPVAVNGGFFAYEGAAIGAVKLRGKWVRLPWKNRIALCLGETGAVITNVRGNAQLTLAGKALPVANLNGNPSKDAISILTSAFGDSYALKTGETALVVEEDADTRGIIEIVTDGIVKIPSGNSFIAVANGAAQAAYAGVTKGQAVSWQVVSTPDRQTLAQFHTILGAGPRLLLNGKAAEASREEEFRPDVLQRGPRTAIGTDAQGNPLIVVADGRSDCSPGLTLPELATLVESLGASQAMHMDCGPSSVLVINGKVANHPMANQPSGLNEPTVPNTVLITDHD